MQNDDPYLPTKVVRPTISLSVIMEMSSPQLTPVLPDRNAPQTMQSSSPFSGIGGAFSPPKKRQRKHSVLMTATSTPLAPVCDKPIAPAISSCPLLPLIPLSLTNLGNIANASEETTRSHVELAEKVGHRLFPDNQQILRSLFVDAVIKCHEESMLNEDNHNQKNSGIFDHEVSVDGDDTMMHDDMHGSIRLIDLCRPLYDEKKKSMSEKDADAEDSESRGLTSLDLCYCAWTIMMLGKNSTNSNSNSIARTMNNR